MKIGLLDFGIRADTINSMGVIEDLLDYAVKADSLGFNRIWLSEHHNFNPLAAWLNPEILIPIIAGLTNKIKVGSGGILLRNHSSYRIAYTFKLLNNLFDNRIDLGLAKGYTSKNMIDSFEEPSMNSSLQFEENLESLVNFFRNEEELFEKEMILPPYHGTAPEIWYLTGSYNNLDSVRDMGLNISRSLFHHGSDIDYNIEKLREFKESFFKKHKRYPKISIAFSGSCHINEKKAKATFEGFKFGFIPDNIVGSPSLFEDKLNEYKELYGISEFIFMNVALNPEDRCKGIELLSKNLKLS